jgi:tetratricopeptide (TPR) repeat protein
METVREGVRLHNAGNYREALECYGRVLQKEPENVLTLRLAGCTLVALQRPQDALGCLQRALAGQPDSPETLNYLGDAHLGLGRLDEAIADYRAATALKAGYPEAWCSLGHALGKVRRFDEAEAALRRAMVLRTNYVEALNRLGIVFKDQNRLDEAIEYFLQAIAARPAFVQGWNNLGNALKAQNKLDEAIVAYRQALTIEPRNARAHLYLAFVRLLKGELRESWLNYEYRWVAERNSPQRDFTQPFWRGEHPLAAKSILLHAEQGLGDTIQFVRYAPLLAAQGASVHLQVQPALKALLSNSAGVTSVVQTGEPLPPFDFHCPFLSLPLALRTGLDSIPNQVPYVQAPPDRVRLWESRLPPLPALRVGVVWRGNSRHGNDSNRSIRFETFRRLFEVESCEFVSLNLGLTEREAQVFADTAACRDPSDLIADFADTAAIVSLLDLVVTVDTSVAHLAGAMGRPVWMLLPFAPDWRWMLAREDSPWYPTMRLFRQPAIGDWNSVISTVGNELRRRVSCCGGPAELLLQPA